LASITFTVNLHPKRASRGILGKLKKMNFRYRGIIAIVLLLAFGLPLSTKLVHLLAESWWFESVGFSQVFWTRLTWQILIWAIAFVGYSLFVWGNYWLAMEGTRHREFSFLANSELELYSKPVANYVVLGAIALAALIAAASSIPAWTTVLKYLHSTEFGSRDPIFRQDIGFYIFRLPLYEGIYNWLLGILALALGVSCLVYSLKGAIVLDRYRRPRLSARAKIHLSVLLGAIALLVAWKFWLDRYHLLDSPEGVVFGAGYTDVHAKLLAYQVLTILGVIVAVLFFVSSRQQGFALPLSGIGLFFVALVLVDNVYPWFVEQFIVNPNQLVKEKPYIEHNIKFTQAAYHLDDVQQQNYAAETQLDRQSLENNQPTIRNIRLWDYRPLLNTYRQLQEIRLYYKFRDVDIDRYTFNGDYQQVMLSGRELVFAQVPQKAQTWVNQRLKYTHGYGLVMSPVNQIAADGLPELYIKDIPPVSQVDLELEQPAIYYGEETDTYIFTGTTTPEFDYPLGDTNAFTNYSGKGGVPLPSIWHRLAYAYDLHSLQILISNYFTPQSRIHYYRQIQERVAHVAPFLSLDSDPYLTVIDGKLQWIVDAYTTSDRYPYAEPVAFNKDAPVIFQGEKSEQIFRGNINYIRNSVKVAIDAYDGTMRFFVVDRSDPVLATYRKIFPNLFEPYAAIAPQLKAHFRYPLDLFKIQAQMYLSYHMSDPEVFYNREDLWRFPLEIYEGNEQMVEPYYVIMRLPGEAREEFLLILPFTPVNKDNMIAWMAARSNGSDYGKLLLYEFPKQKLVFGPRQIEARIDQTPQISQQFTLWSQAGSKVVRGDLLVIPIEQSLLYVEPIYLRAEQGELPELKRVVVAYNNAIAMEETLEQALAAIFGSKKVDKEKEVPNLAPTSEVGNLAKSALATYQKAREALQEGNWSEYGRYQQELKSILENLNREASSE
jgi:hypothetical protein